MAKDLKVEDQKLEVPKDFSLTKILSQADAESYAKHSGFKSCMVTEDKCIYLLDAAEHALNHAIDNKLKVYTVK
jgi:hypothetical protein